MKNVTNKDIWNADKSPEWKLLQLAFSTSKNPDKLTYESLSYFTGLSVRKIWNVLHE
jgi:hypothetical protein